MKPALYIGTVAHKRYLPVVHRFQYAFFMWYLNLDELNNLPALGRWFSTRHWAISRFKREDYYGDPSVPLADAIREKMKELTGKPVTGQVCGLLNMRTLGLYFSPVNFYYGYDMDGILTHFLAEVSNIPWNERHQYAHYVADGKLNPIQDKEFKVSPFNSVSQLYSWKLSEPDETVAVQLAVDDERGHIFKALLKLSRYPLTKKRVMAELLKKPAMTLFMIAAIYWQAFRLYIKGVPYVPYTKEIQ